MSFAVELPPSLSAFLLGSCQLEKMFLSAITLALMGRKDMASV